MISKAVKVLSMAMLLLVLALPAFSQNTKGDRPQPDRESRFSKSDKKKVKTKKRRSNIFQSGKTRSNTSARSRRVRPRTVNERPKNVYSQRSPFVGNASKGPKGERTKFSKDRRTNIRNSSPGRQDDRSYGGDRYVSGRSRSPKERKTRFKPAGSLNQVRSSSPGRQDDRAYTQGRNYVSNYSTSDRKRRRVITRPATASGRIRNTPPRRTEYRVRASTGNRYVNNKVSKAPRNKNRVYKGPLTRRIRNASPGKRDDSPNAQAGYSRNSSSTGQRRPSAIGGGGNFSGRAGTGPGKRARIKPRSASRSFIMRKSINLQARYPRPKRRSEQAHTRDIAGRRLRTKNYESPKPGVIPNYRTTRYSISGRNRGRSAASARYGQYRNFSSKQGTQRHVGAGRNAQLNYLRPPRRSERAVSNASTLGALKSLQSKRRPRASGTVSPRSASRPFRTNKSTNLWARFPRPKKRSGRAVTTDIAGKPLRTRNYESPRQGVIPQISPYTKTRRIGDRPYGGRAAGSYRSATRTKPRAWQGDVAGRSIRGIKTPKQDSPSGIRLGGYRSATKTGRAGRPIPVRQPGIWAEVLRFRTGKIKGQQPIKGGGSVSGRLWNNRGTAIQPKAPGLGADGLGKYQGNLKGSRPLKGGGSISGRLWNNKNSALDTRIPPKRAAGAGRYSGNIRIFDRPGFSNQGEEYTGDVKFRRPAKGGGSVSGRLWNNKNTALDTRIPPKRAAGAGRYSGNIRIFDRPGFSNQGEEYTGDVKFRRPAKGGGSVSGRLWNNNNSAIITRVPAKKAMKVGGFPGKMRRFDKPGFSNQGEEYTGDVKASKPVKGGGSVSGKLWNNKQSPIEVRIPGAYSRPMQNYQGNLKAMKPIKGGGSVSGKLWNNKNTPIAVRTPGKASMKIDSYSGFLKASRPVKGGGSVSGKLWNNKEEPLEVRAPEPHAAKAGNFSGTLKMSTWKRDYLKNPNASAFALKKQRPDKSVYQEGELQTKIRQYNYIRNRNASLASLKVREPGRSFGRAADFQGNVKMQKFRLFDKNAELHPDARFVKANKNNVDGEKDVPTNLKLWWARLFKKNETQPDHLKEKERKPRYDKGEAGLWYD